jgi:hypothetical protein
VEWGDQSAPRIAASEEGVPASFGGVVSLDLINALATNRTKANMNPYIRKRVPNPSFRWHMAQVFIILALHLDALLGSVRAPIGLRFET